MKKLMIFMGLLMMSVFVNAQLNDGSKPEIFKGVVYDLKTSQPLNGAEIKIQTLVGEMITLSDDLGYFLLTGVAKTPFNITISMTGYEDKILHQVNKVEDVEYYIGLEPKGVKHLSTGY
ncbi:MAG: carboxypeptidase-like regulatory domain-containing protein [Saprospiraceae bacterium]|nr:carboxypeptidase-like regulatory domain-containing protein [Saprospiraceae bacterium]MBK7810192.1 carboxypeptidase-like regulatory domain-containing protein [Saprospiraceae bacterium]MBK9629796.1 carboxypeptidase-like regulatory domain-containing protein [Saprospiraceae bacterium]